MLVRNVKLKLTWHHEEWQTHASCHKILAFIRTGFMLLLFIHVSLDWFFYSSFKFVNFAKYLLCCYLMRFIIYTDWKGNRRIAYIVKLTLTNYYDWIKFSIKVTKLGLSHISYTRLLCILHPPKLLLKCVSLLIIFCIAYLQALSVLSVLLLKLFLK